MSELKPCPKCGRAVRIRQEWHYNQTRLVIDCKCGNHLATDWVHRGEPLPVPREGFATVWNTVQRLKEASDEQDI